MAEARALFEAGEPVPSFGDGGFGEGGFGDDLAFGGGGEPPSFGAPGFGDEGEGATGLSDDDLAANLFGDGGAGFGDAEDGDEGAAGASGQDPFAALGLADVDLGDAPDADAAPGHEDVATDGEPVDKAAPEA
jgi:hypothetical protein